MRKYLAFCLVCLLSLSSYSLRWDPVRDSSHIVRNTGRVLKKGSHDWLRSLLKAGRDTSVEVSRDGRNVGRTIWKATTDTGNEFANTGKALAQFVVAQAIAERKALTAVERRIISGRIDEAIFYFGIDQIRDTEGNAVRMAQKSFLIRTGAQIAAGVFGGPGGAAAFASWYTYRTKNNLVLALKAGVIAGASTYAFKGIGEMKDATAPELAAKTIAAASVGGVAVALAGGNEHDVLRGALLAGGAVLAEAEYSHIMRHDIDLRPEHGEAYNKLSPGEPGTPPPDAYDLTKSGEIHLDMRLLDPNRSHVGMWAHAGDSGFFQETSRLMIGVAKVPLMNAMAYLHDYMVAELKLPVPISIGTIPVATAFTYMGTDAPFENQILNLIREKSDAEAAKDRDDRQK